MLETMNIKIMQKGLTQPCGACPFRRKSMAGWLGEETPKGFMQTTMNDVAMPCHCTIDYEDPKWKENFVANGKAEHCAGALIFFRNICKLSRDPERPRLEADHDNVFSSQAEFLDHHNRKNR